MKNYTLKVHNVLHETKDTVTICFKQPSLRKIKYQAGQYLTLSLLINGRKYKRPYSFSSAPSVDTFLETTIKRVSNGVFSNYINDTIKIGDVIEVMEPMGDFVYTNNDSIDQIYFWGVGSGITPLISIIKEVLISNPLFKLNLIYGNKNFETTIFLDVINKLLSEYPDNLKVWHFHTQYNQNKNHDFIKKGRINQEFVINLLKDVNIEETTHYICGPLDLKDTIKSTLAFLQCPNENVFSEDFELVRNPKDFEDIITHKIKINFQGNDTLVEVKKGQSILESALDAGLELPYSCQTGNCDTCKGALKSGKLKMIGLPKERNDLQKEDYLLCCSHPLTDDVYIMI
jgi:ring-1,2-phenylacetyl-CoA epoxidase subunit PaaE